MRVAKWTCKGPIKQEIDMTTEMVLTTFEADHNAAWQTPSSNKTPVGYAMTWRFACGSDVE